MSYTDSSLQIRIQQLRTQFEKVDSADWPSDQENDQEALFSLHATIRLAVISNLLKTMENSLDHISICFEVSRAMYFYQDEISRDVDFWTEERRVNQMLCSNNFKMAIADMQTLGTKLNAQLTLLQPLQEADQAAIKATILLVDKYKELVGRFNEAAEFLNEMRERQRNGYVLFNPDQRPDIKGQSPESCLKSLHLESSQRSDEAITLNVDLAESLFESARLTKIMIELDSQDLNQELALILNRFAILEDARDNRFGFTQIRFE